MDYGIGAATVEIDVDVAFCHEMPLYNAPFVDEIDERGRGDGKYSGEKGARMINEAKQATTVGRYTAGFVLSVPTYGYLSQFCSRYIRYIRFFYTTSCA